MKRLLVISGIGSIIINALILLKYELGRIDYSIGCEIELLILVTAVIMALINFKIDQSVLIMPKTEQKQEAFVIEHVAADFLVGINQVDGIAFYYFYLREKDSYKLTRVPALDTEIIESSKAELKVITTNYLKSIGPGAFERLLKLEITKAKVVKDEYRKDKELYKLYVPVGSIKML